MRLFLALELDAPLRASLTTVAAALRRRWPARGSWVRPENLHLTLRFLGEVDRTRAAALGDALAPALLALAPALSALAPALSARAPFGFEVAGLGAFPNPAWAAVLWAGIQPCPELLQIHATIENILRDMGFPPEEKPFTPHLTLARIRERVKVPDGAAVLEALSGDVAGVVRTREVILLESKLSPAGPTYSVVRRFPLSG